MGDLMTALLHEGLGEGDKNRCSNRKVLSAGAWITGREGGATGLSSIMTCYSIRGRTQGSGVSHSSKRGLYL